jgi:hypothetical protein
MSRSTFIRSILTPLALSALLSAPAVMAQSTAASQVSAISMEPSEASAAVALEAIPAGSQLVVTALHAVGDVVEVSVQAAGESAAITLRVGADAVHASGMAVGTTLVVTAVSAGLLVSAAGEVVCFVPDQMARSLIHSREL